MNNALLYFKLFFVAVKTNFSTIVSAILLILSLIAVKVYDHNTSLFINLLLVVSIICFIFYLAIIFAYEKTVYDVNIKHKLTIFVTDMLYDLYNKISETQDTTSFTLYISQEIYDIIKKYDFIDKLNIVIEENRHGKSYGYVPKGTIVDDIDEFFELK